MLLYLFGFHSAEQAGLFSGYTRRDRRKQHVAEADAAVDALLRRARVDGATGTLSVRVHLLHCAL